MKLPLVVLEGLDLMLFPSTDDAELKLEAIDVRDQVYDAFDAEALVLIPTVVENRVRILESDPEVFQPDLLCDRLRQVLGQDHDEERLNHASLPELLVLCEPYLLASQRSSLKDDLKNFFRRTKQS